MADTAQRTAPAGLEAHFEEETNDDKRILDILRERTVKARDAMDRAYQGLVQRISAGAGDLQPEAVEDVLQSTGRSVDQLADDVRAEQRRQQHQTALRQRPQLVEKSVELRKRIADLEGERRRAIEAVENQYRERIQTVRGELAAVEWALELADRSLADLTRLVLRADQENALVERREEVVE